MNKKLALFFVMISLFLSSAGQALAFSSGKISFNEVLRYDDLFRSYEKKDLLNRNFNCEKLREQIEIIEDKTDNLKEKINEETDLEKIEKYKSNKRSYGKAEILYRNNLADCSEDKGITPPVITEIFTYKKGDYDDIDIEIEDREKGQVRLRYMLDEEGDKSMSAQIVITKDKIYYPFDIKDDYEVYNVTFKPEEERFYLKGNFASYKDYYLYVLPTFSTTDYYFTTRPFGIVNDEDKKIIDFKDVSKENRFYNSIKKARSMGLVNGFRDNTYKPNEFMKRKEFLKIALPADDIEKYAGEKLEFKDIENIEWLNKYLKKATKEDVILNSEYFYPDKGITYLEAMKMLSKIYKLDIKWDETEVKGLEKDHWGVSLVNFFKNNSIISDKSDNFDRPMRRDEAVDLVVKTMEKNKV